MQAPLQSRNDSDSVQPSTARATTSERLLDNRPAADTQRKLADMIDNSPRVLQQRTLSDAIHNGAAPAELSPVQRAIEPNRTGLPDQLKSGIESLSGMSMDHVKVHYNSEKPAQLQAHAYAQGSEIHVGPGQEQHLPHEAWHIVQQAQGRVRPTMQMKAITVNDDPSLEKEADIMGEKAAQFDGGHVAPASGERAAGVVTQRSVGFTEPAHPAAAHGTLQLHRVVPDDRNWAEAETQTLFKSVPELNAIREALLGTEVDDWTSHLKERCIELVRNAPALESLLAKYIQAENARRAQYGGLLPPLNPSDVEDHIVMIAAHVRMTLQVLGSGEFDTPDNSEQVPSTASAKETHDAKRDDKPGTATGKLGEQASALIARGDVDAVFDLMMQIQRRRARNGPDAESAEAKGAEGVQAELLCLHFLNDAKVKLPDSAQPSHAKVSGGSIPQIGASFAAALELCEEKGRTIWGEDREALVLDALQQATENLLFFMIANQIVLDLDTLNHVADLDMHRERITALPLTPDSDDYNHAYERLKEDDAEIEDDAKAAYVKQHPKGQEALAPRIAIRAGKAANMWLKVATPYVTLKRAFLDGWADHEHGTLAKRGFYYSITRSPEQAEYEIAGDKDKQAAIVEPVSGKVAFGILLQEVFDSAACHEDALKFVELLGGKVCAAGRLRQVDGGSALLPVIKLTMLKQIQACDSPMVGLRLRDDSHHSLVLLFEQIEALGLMGAKFETVAGKNTEQILHLMEAAHRLSAAWTLIDQNLSKAIQESKPGWVLQWEVFTVDTPELLKQNLASRVDATMTGIETGKTRHERTRADTNSLFGFEADDPDRPEWETEATAHVESVKAGKAGYLAAKKERQKTQEAALEEKTAVLEGELQEARHDTDKLKVVLQKIYDELGDSAMFNMALRIGLGFEKVIALMPHLQ